MGGGGGRVGEGGREGRRKKGEEEGRGGRKRGEEKGEGEEEREGRRIGGGAGGEGGEEEWERYDNDVRKKFFYTMAVNDALYNYGVPRPSSELSSSITWDRSHNFSTSPKSCGKKDGGKVLSRCSHTPPSSSSTCILFIPRYRRSRFTNEEKLQSSFSLGRMSNHVTVI